MESFSQQLMQRFDVPGPRYTSYPTADQFREDLEGSALRKGLDGQVSGVELPLSVYVHVPFCESVCYYCACNKIVTKDHGKAEKYLSYLRREIHLVSSVLNGYRGERVQVSQIHLGGGSPTFLDDAQLADLMSFLSGQFSVPGDAERSIEVDPRTVDGQRLARLRGMGFNRLSFGVQDFDPKVQEAIHRVQSYDRVEALVHAARQLRFDSVNLDLIYGLPHQNEETFSWTVQQVCTLRPDRVALYAYAHLPKRFKPQRRIDPAALPNAETKLRLLNMAIEALLHAGYEYIGMDHFALPDDVLAQARKKGRLQRNFQGYHTGSGGDLLGFGVSAISQVGGVYSQNLKTLEGYYGALDEARLPAERSLMLHDDDRLRREVIMGLMCQGRLEVRALEKRHGIHFEEYFSDALSRLQEFEGFGLLKRTADELEVTSAGWFFVRPMAMAFDRYLWQHQDHQRFSRVL